MMTIFTALVLRHFDQWVANTLRIFFVEPVYLDGTISAPLDWKEFALVGRNMACIQLCRYRSLRQWFFQKMMLD